MSKSNEIKMTRKVAARMIEDIRTMLAGAKANPAGANLARDLDVLLSRAGIPALEACTGEAHSNAHIDNCGCCAPRWGWTGDAVKIT